MLYSITYVYVVQLGFSSNAFLSKQYGTKYLYILHHIILHY